MHPPPSFVYFLQMDGRKWKVDYANKDDFKFFKVGFQLPPSVSQLAVGTFIDVPADIDLHANRSGTGRRTRRRPHLARGQHLDPHPGEPKLWSIRISKHLSKHTSPHTLTCWC